MLRILFPLLLAVSAAGPALAGPKRPRNVPEIDLFAGATVLMIAIVVGLLLWEWHRRPARQ